MLNDQRALVRETHRQQRIDGMMMASAELMGWIVGLAVWIQKLQESATLRNWHAPGAQHRDAEDYEEVETLLAQDEPEDGRG